MRLKNILCIFALLCTVVQGAWAQNFDVWDGVTTKKPSGYYVDPEDDWYITINSAAELAYVMQNYKPDPTYEFSNLPWPPFVLGSTISKASCEVNFILNADVDMTAGTWIPIGTNLEEKRFYKGFYGLERETLRIDCYRRLASTPHPFNDNDNITKDYCENQLEIAVRFSQIIRAFAEMIILWTKTLSFNNLLSVTALASVFAVNDFCLRFQRSLKKSRNFPNLI